MNTKDYSIWGKTGVCTESVWCPFCYGTGLTRKRLGRKDLDPRITIERCIRCKGMRRIWVNKDSSLYKKAKNLVIGLWPRTTW